jgi:hypothetical protein
MVPIGISASAVTDARSRLILEGTMDGLLFRSSCMAVGDGTHRLPIRAELQRALGKEAGNTVAVQLEEGY